MKVRKIGDNILYVVVILKDADGKVVGATIAVSGQPETDDVLNALQDVEKLWEEGEG